MPRIRAGLLLASFLICTNSAGVLAGPMLTNGDFSIPGTPTNPFDSWTTSFGEPPQDGGGFALFAESLTSSIIELEQSFTLPSNAFSLSFDLQFQTSGAGISTLPPDSFQSSLYVDGVDAFPTPSDPFLPAFYSIDAAGNVTFDSTYVSTTLLANGWSRVTLDVSSLAGKDVLLEFILNSFDDERTSQASLDNVVITTTSVVVPEPATVTSLMVGLGLVLVSRVLARRRIRTC